MTISRVLTSVALTAMLSCGNSGSDGAIGPTGLQGPEGPAGPMGDTGSTGNNGTNGTAGAGADLALPGGAYYPESLTALSDGTLFVGSFGTGEVWKYAPNAQAPTRFISTAAGIKTVTGVLTDEANGLLYVCAVDSTATPFTSAVKSFNLADGTLNQTYAFPGTGNVGACNDMTFDGAGNLFVTDSFGSINKLPSGGTALASWVADAKLQPAPGGFGADGIVYDGAGHFFVTNFNTNKLYRVTVNNDGTAGAIDEIVVSPALTAPDGMRLINATTLLVVENKTPGGRLTQIAVTGTTGAGTVLDNRLDSPTSVVTVGKNYFITEGQIAQLFTGSTPMPNLPFLIRRLPTFN